ncbi:glycoside hydrolase family 3 N-terminal domain-containing protein [Saccharibacillus sp. CPCC 101409]|uniref:glycoside hydrolase family 3 N-terminal domain-containing protein n=1 Tax=Saccharibacillus sp. CPCC 101409 TaxID=3058041 RepID=UPI0026710BFD|nr:glycoside hydrolase family 3 N-terminal domain-containing protein [Saccharibacillus sp. CPCC 101409]MDO3408274.1 glycoside hydrolase family 3 N-terminal domain-containing protein [Saccharibacillus sp. CPCC 101409]
MTLEEKIAQLTSARTGSMISDVENFVFSAELTAKNVPHGCGYIGRIGGATDLLPAEMARAMNEIQKHFMEETRLGIPVLFMTEATSGVLSRNHTLFPQNIGAGAMFDEEPVREMADAMRREMTATGERWALGPVVDVIRDHRYGRYEESFGEDVYLASRYGSAYVRGLQSDDLTRGVAATLKHFVAQGISDGGRNCGPVHVTDRELLDGYAVPFEAAIREAGALSVMAAYHEIDQVPVHASSHILRDLLQDKLGFDGLTVSDGNGIQLIQSFQEYCGTQEEAVKLALEAGIECELDFMFTQYLQGLVERGEVKQALVDAAVRKVLSLKFRLGLFDRPYVDESAVDASVCAPDMVELSKRMALRSMTLLKNEDGILPLNPSFKKIAVIGPLAHVKEFAYSDYSYPAHIEDMYYSSEGLTEEEVLARTLFFKKKNTRYEDLYHDMHTVYEALKSALPETEVVYSAGLKDTYDYHGDADFYRIDEAVDAARDADVIIAVCGDTSGMGRENDSGESTDRVEIGLSQEQKKLLRDLKETGRPVVLVLCNGRPLELLEESESMDAILEAWKPGMRGAEAIAETLTGAYNPGGKLPVTLPKALGQLPVHYSQLATGHKQFWRGKYLEMDLAPLYPFGYGLSYTTFEAENAKFELTDSGVKIEADVLNTGEDGGDQVVQVYVRKKYASVLQPERELKAYKRVSIPAGGRASLVFEILFDSIGYHDREMKLVLENVQLDVMLGFSSQDIRAEKTFKLEFEGGRREIGWRVFGNKVLFRLK